MIFTMGYTYMTTNGKRKYLVNCMYYTAVFLIVMISLLADLWKTMKTVFLLLYRFKYRYCLAFAILEHDADEWVFCVTYGQTPHATGDSLIIMLGSWMGVFCDILKEDLAINMI